MRKRLSFSMFMLILGLAFLYVPLILIVVSSFNESPLMSTWGGISLRWYVDLFGDEQFLEATWISLKVAALCALGSMMLSTMTAFVLVRLKHFKGYHLFSFLISTPLVLPEVITGLSLLMLFVAMKGWIGFPETRGIFTIWIAHVTMASAYATVVIASRLQEIDESLELAAIDLGAGPMKAFLTVTLPIVFPAIIAGGLLSFTLSLDDVVVASFVSGPSSTTLPMAVFSSIRLGLSPKINALATLFIGIVSMIVIVAILIFAKRLRSKDRF